MKVYGLFKYLLRFIILQSFLTYFTIWYFDNFLIGNYLDGYNIIIKNLLEDRDRFYGFVANDFIKIDIYLALFVFIFLVILYLSKFYSYVNELTFSANKTLFDEFLSIYLIWTASYLSFLQIFRFTSVSRGYLILFTFIVPIFLVAFRNSEFISTLLGRNPSKENYISFNLDSNSVFNELRILGLRNHLSSYTTNAPEDFNFYKKAIEEFNKQNEVNLIVFDLSALNNLTPNFENYLFNLNKKILIIANLNFTFSKQNLARSEMISGKNIFYINNDIQYGSKFIVKRVIDILFVILTSLVTIPISLFTYFYILITDGRPAIIKQTRVGLHGKNFNMFKFRTMRNNSHKERDDLMNLNEHSGPLFKIENDPRIFKGGKALRRFSIDEIPQLINVLRGEMSIVGPRPLFPEDNKHFDEHYIRRLNVLPGVTGLLQINERNTDDFNIWYKYDIEYIENWSVLLDLKIIFKTPFALFTSKSSGK